MPRIPALIKPDLLIWGRKTSGLNVEEAARRLKVTAATLDAWEKGREALSVAKLSEVADLYRRPLAVFFLPNPPSETQPLTDFRTAADARKSTELVFQIRRAHERRDIALELFEELDEEPPRFGTTATASAQPEIVGSRLRSLLAVTTQAQQRWKDPRIALNSWREAFERVGVLVFHARKIRTREARGFSIGADVLPAVVVNTKDSYAGRIFTMFHELTHVSLRKGGLCDLSNDRAIELFCNACAAAALVPRTDLLGERDVALHSNRDSWPADKLRSLARLYSVSEEAVMRRLVSIGKASQHAYDEHAAIFRSRENERSDAEEKSKGGPSPAVLAVLYNGPAYTRLVLDAYKHRVIPASRVTDYLSVRFKHLEAIRENLATPTQRRLDL